MKTWSPSEDEILRRLYRNEITRAEAMAQLSRTEKAIDHRASRLGITDQRPREPGQVEGMWAKVVEVCADGRPRTFAEIGAALGIKHEAVKYLMTSRRTLEQAHIADFKKVLGHYRALWLPVPGKDAQPPNGNWKGGEAAPPRPKPKWRVPEQHEVIRAMYGMGVAA